MNREEAIRLLDPKTTRETLAEIEYYGGFSGDVACVAAIEDACMLAIEALEKQTTKYKHIGTRLTYWGKYKYIFKCEICGLTKEFTDNHTAQYKYCPSCGREINWSKPKGDSYDFAIIDEAAVQKGNKDD